MTSPRTARRCAEAVSPDASWRALRTRCPCLGGLHLQLRTSDGKDRTRWLETFKMASAPLGNL
jgi:hypothetical protein